MKMKCTEEKLMNDLVEVYTYHYKRAVEMDRGDSQNANHAYELGKEDGAVEALSAIMLQVFGGKAFYEIWTKTMEWATKGDKE